MSFFARLTENVPEKMLRHAREGNIESFNGMREAYPAVVPDFSGIDFTPVEGEPSYWRLGDCNLRGVTFTDAQAMQLIQYNVGGFNRWRKDIKAEAKESVEEAAREVFLKEEKEEEVSVARGELQKAVAAKEAHTGTQAAENAARKAAEVQLVDLREQGAFAKLDMALFIDDWRGVLLSEAQQAQLAEKNPRAAEKYRAENLAAGVAEGADATTITPISHGVTVAGAQVEPLANAVSGPTPRG